MQNPGASLFLNPFLPILLDKYDFLLAILTLSLHAFNGHELSRCKAFSLFLSFPNWHPIFIVPLLSHILYNCNWQGGLIFLETISLAKLVLCCKVYFWLLVNLPLRATSNLVKDSVTPISAGGNYIATSRDSEREAAAVPLGANVQIGESQLNAIQCLDIELSRLSLTLVIADKSGNRFILLILSSILPPNR